MAGQAALAAAGSGNADGTVHGGEGGEVIDVPSEGFSAPSVAIEPGGEIPLSRADVEIVAGGEAELPQLADEDSAGAGKMEDGNVDAAVFSGSTGHEGIIEEEEGSENCGFRIAD